MDPMLTSTLARLDVGDEIMLVHEWRAEQLRRLGVSQTQAEAFAGEVDWHDVAALIERGCSPALAVEIVR